MSFDLLAPHYRWMELVLAGGKLQRCRTAFLDKLGSFENALVLGEGNGRFLLELRGKAPAAKITVLDASAPMLQKARQRLQAASLPLDKIKFVHANALLWIPEEHYDLVATHFFLDCFTPEQLRSLITKIANCAHDRAVWLLSDFQLPPEGAPRFRAKAIHWMMYRFFHAITRIPARHLTEPDEFLKENGFDLAARTTSDWGLLRADLWERRVNRSSPSPRLTSTCGAGFP